MNMPTIENEYKILKEYYDEVLNKDSSLVKTSNDEPTPLTCVEEMVNKIPDDFWKSEDIKILDPCCGCGNFPIVIYFKLLKYHAKEKILSSMLYFNDMNQDRLDVLNSVFNHELNVYNEDFLEFSVPIDFDLIIESVKKTNRCVTVEESFPVCSIGSYIGSQIMIRAFDYLDAPVLNCTGKDVPMPYAENLEKAALITPDEIVFSVKQVLYKD